MFKNDKSQIYIKNSPILDSSIEKSAIKEYRFIDNELTKRICVASIAINLRERYTYHFQISNNQTHQTHSLKIQIINYQYKKTTCLIIGLVSYKPLKGNNNFFGTYTSNYLLSTHCYRTTCRTYILIKLQNLRIFQTTVNYLYRTM